MYCYTDCNACNEIWNQFPYQDSLGLSWVPSCSKPKNHCNIFKEKQAFPDKTQEPLCLDKINRQTKCEVHPEINEVAWQQS